MPLELRPLGKTGLKVSCLGLGTVKFGRNRSVRYPRCFTIPADRQITALLELARGLGINLVDTAPAYGNSERRLGRLLPQRQDWVLCTKVGEEFRNGKSRYDFSGAHTRRSIERSLRRLRCDCIDVALVHSDGDDLGIIEGSDCLETLFKLKDEGLIRAVGMSTKSTAGGIQALRLTDLVMVTYNPTNTADAVVIDTAARLGKGVLIKKALESGHSGEAGAAANLRFALGRGGVSSVVVGTINPRHLRANVAAVAPTLPT